MPPKPAPTTRIVTRSQSKAKTQVAQTQTDTGFCVCPTQKHTLPIMDEGQKEEFKNLFKEFVLPWGAISKKGRILSTERPI